MRCTENPLLHINTGMCGVRVPCAVPFLAERFLYRRNAFNLHYDVAVDIAAAVVVVFGDAVVMWFDCFDSASTVVFLMLVNRFFRSSALCVERMRQA